MLTTTLTLALLATAPSAQQEAPPTQINVEIDYMVDGIHSHKPSQAVIDALVQMFACQGIVLNLFVDDAVPHVAIVKCPNLSSPFFSCIGTSSFLAYKNSYGDTNGLPGWHYCLIGHDYDSGSGPGSSGRGETLGNDFIVTLGSFNGGVGGTNYEIAATIAHELGHNLGLQHLSPASSLAFNTEDFAPNYASLMSYQYQLSGVASQMECLGLVGNDHTLKDLDYSHGRMGNLPEASLNEKIGVGIHPVDWDCDGLVDSTTVNRNLDLANNWCTTGNGIGILRDYDDWANIVDATFDADIASDAFPMESVACITRLEHERTLYESFQDPNACPGSTPTLKLEACVSSSTMAWVDPATTAPIPKGSATAPYKGLFQALTVTPNGSVLYLQPGTYTNGGAPLVISTKRVLAGPGGAFVDP